MRDWHIVGPDVEKLSLEETARKFGYEPKTWRELIRQGRVPSPRGHGSNTYYTGLDVAIITEMFGRWAPAEPDPEKGRTSKPREDG